MTRVSIKALARTAKKHLGIVACVLGLSTFTGCLIVEKYDYTMAMAAAQDWRRGDDFRKQQWGLRVKEWKRTADPKDVAAVMNYLHEHEHVTCEEGFYQLQKHGFDCTLFD